MFFMFVTSHISVSRNIFAHQLYFSKQLHCLCIFGTSCFLERRVASQILTHLSEAESDRRLALLFTKLLSF